MKAHESGHQQEGDQAIQGGGTRQTKKHVGMDKDLTNELKEQGIGDTSK
jgi:hypothetical protein